MEADSLSKILDTFGIESDSLSTHPSYPALVTLRAPGGEPAVECWSKLRSAARHTQHWPIILGEVNEANRRVSELTFNDLASRLGNIPSGNPLSALRREQNAVRDRLWAFGASFPEIPQELIEEAKRRDEEQAGWPDQPTSEDRFPSSVFNMFEQRPFDECLIALLPTVEPSHAPIYLQFGGFNGCPSAEIHAAFLQDWWQRFGAVPICMTSDVLECFVERPPPDPDASRVLAREQNAYAPDIVDGPQPIDHLAIELWRSPYWFFWWD